MTNEEKKAMETIKDLKEIKWYEHAFDSGTEILSEEEKQDIDVILNLIEKQSKEIEELKAINKKLEARKYMYNAETGEVTAIPIDNNYISKDKIRAKIEIRKEEKENCKDSIEEKYLLREIYILQSLLNEEE